MKPKFKNITEQIERIKSLFNEDRLYGNLINEQCSSAQEASDYLENLGYIVAEPTSTGARSQRGKLLSCLNDPTNIILKNANDQVKHVESTSPAARVEIKDKPVCSLLITPKFIMGNNVRVTIKRDGTLYVYWQSKSPTTISLKLVGYIGYKGTTDGITYTDLEYDRCYLPTGAPIPMSNKSKWADRIFESSNLSTPCKYGGPDGFLYRLTDIKESGTIKDLADKIPNLGNVMIEPKCRVA